MGLSGYIITGSTRLTSPDQIHHHRLRLLHLVFSSLSAKPTSKNIVLSQIMSCPKLNNPKLKSLSSHRVNVSFFRLVSTKSSGFRNVVDKPVKSVISSAFVRYREAIGLHVDAFWKKNSRVLFGVVGVFVCILFWRVMFGVANTFVGLSEGKGKYGFPVKGSERKGLVSVEYDKKLLAVDIPMASGPDQRLFLFGDEEEYKVGGGLISELRDAVVKAMAATTEFENLDRLEEEEDDERELQEAERKHREDRSEKQKEHSIRGNVPFGFRQEQKGLYQYPIHS
ncbi:unnamed protein product [Cochlearia groenlandica]